MSKLKVSLSKVFDLLISRALSPFTDDPRTIAGKFYLKTLPKMATLPRPVEGIPRVNLWLWLIGYLRIQWPEVESKTEKVFWLYFWEAFRDAVKLSLDKLVKVKNPTHLKSLLPETGVSQRTKKWGNR